MFHNVHSPLKNLIRIITLSVSFSIFISLNALSQNSDPYSNSYPAEKIYLQLDGKVYTTDKIIWFKAIVANADDHAPSSISGVLYVELISPDEAIIEKKLIKLKNGCGDGFFELSQDFPEGTYLIRAYTKWNENFGTDFFFQEYIQVFGTSEQVKTVPIRNITLLEKENQEHRLTAFFDPLAIDSLHKKDLTLFLNIDNKKDTLSIRKADDNQYKLDYSVPDNCQFITLTIQTKNLLRYIKTIALNEDRLDLQFFPESGELVDGLESKVGFKALDYNGKGKHIEGEIINGSGEVVSFFKSNQLGMGSFLLDKADKNTTYSARLKSQSDERISNIYPLPEVASKGNILSIVKKGNEILFTTTSNYLKFDSIYIRTSCRGLIYYDIKGQLKEGRLSIYLPADSLPEGIIAFTMLDNTMHPLVERLYFNERPESRINIAIATDKDSYSQREATTLNIKAKDKDGNTVNANLSLLVFNKSQMGQIQNIRQNILSYFLLSSDLKGEIENPGYYFSKGISSHDDIDALLLTQGWRKYKYNKPIDKIMFLPEAKLSITGSVRGIVTNFRKKGAELTLMTFGSHKSVQQLIIDSLGRFTFNIDDEYGQNLNILIQSTNSIGQKRNYTIELDKKDSPPVVFNPKIETGKVDSVVKSLVEKNIERKKVDDTYKLSGGILLGEVKVEAYKMTPNREKVLLKYGKPDKVISGEEIQKKEEKWSSGLYSVIQAKFPDIQIFKTRAVPGYLPSFLMAGLRVATQTLVVVDGITVNLFDYPLIPNIPPSEVSSFEIIKDAKNFRSLFMEYKPDANILDSPIEGDVIAIYTYGGSGIFGVSKSAGILKAAVPVFSEPLEFYAPKYENLQPVDWYKPDLRELIYWEPILIVDSLGNVSSTFYNADKVGEIEVVVEAISQDGKIGYQEIYYNIKKRD